MCMCMCNVYVKFEELIVRNIRFRGDMNSQSKWLRAD